MKIVNFLYIAILGGFIPSLLTFAALFQVLAVAIFLTSHILAVIFMLTDNLFWYIV